MKSYRFILLLLVSIVLSGLFGSPASGAQMDDYCIQPPFIKTVVPPNLLLMIDNSASMYDLSYVDVGTGTRTPSYCYDQTFVSTNSYTGYYDQDKIYSYDLINNYFSEDASGIPGFCDHRIAGHLCIGKVASGPTYTLTKFMASGKYLNWLTASKFDVQKKILTGGKYDTATGKLLPETRGCIGRKFIKEALTADYVEGGTNTSLGITFAVRGPDNEDNPTAPSPGGQTYLNLYFGDYNQGVCQSAIAAYSDPGSSNAAIKKAVDDCLSYTSTASYCQLDIGRTCNSNSDCDNTDGVCANIALPTCSGSPKKCVGGGKAGQACNNANDCKFSTCSAGKVGTVCGRQGSGWDNAVCNSSVGPCVSGTITTASKTGVVFNQTIQACWALKKGTPIGVDETNTVKNQCTDIYDELYTCDGGVNSGKTCTGAAGCPGASCVNGPAAIHPGNPAYLCSNTYTGMCYVGASPGGTWSGSYDDGTTIYTGDNCIIKKHEEFCGDITVPPVVDPTDAPSDSTVFDNLPAIISDIGVEAQLNQPFAVLTVKNNVATAPSGLLNDFSGIIRMGAMSFDFNGSASECGQKVCSNSFTTTCATTADCTGTGTCITPVPCPKVCSSSPAGETVTCSTKLDCPNPTSAFTTCDVTTPGTSNLDGAKVLTYISNSAGDHSTGLIKDIDNIKAKSWTPFSEGFYNAIGYFARTNAYTVATGTSRDDLRINTADFDANKNPSQYKCQENNILLISDGQPTAEKESNVTSLAARYNDGDTQTGFTATCPSYQGTMNLDDLAWLAKNRNIKTFSKSSTTTTLPATASEQISTYVVYTGPNTTGTTECDPRFLMNQTAINGGTTLYNPQNPDDLRDALLEAFRKISGVASSGTAASVLASGEGSGANLVQSIFYPKRLFTTGSSEVSWIGTLANMWYYIDPRLKSSSIREDTASDQALKLKEDRIVEFAFNPVTSQTGMNLFADSNGDGVKDPPGTPTATATLDSLNYLWEAGRLLLKRTSGDENPAVTYAPTARTVYTNTDNDSTLVAFAVSKASTLRPLLGLNTDANAQGLIRYVRGNDSASMDLDGNGTADTLRLRATTVTISGTDVTGVWKLGDTINSTPKLVSWTPLHHYDTTYNDGSYKEFYTSTAYKSRGMVFVGANDGMLHAFKLGLLGIFNEPDRKATLGKYCSGAPTKACSVNGDCPSGTCDTDANMGKEAWAFIPKNALPYLKYLSSTDYCHLYSVDATPVIVDASIMAPGENPSDYYIQTKTSSSWRTVLIGSMRYGGACRSNGTSCSECVSTPIAGSSVGMSSYFALDITDPEAPSLLWEYANSELGLSSTGPAIVRISAKANCSIATGTSCDSDVDCTGDGDTCKQDKTKNGRWFVVVGTGPSGYVSPGTKQFTGVSEHNYLGGDTKGNIKLHVLDLKTGSLVKNIDAGESAAFAGSFANATIDIDSDYSDDALYFGFTARNTLGATQTAQAGSTATTIKLAAGASPINGFYNGKFVHRTDGIHETLLIIDYDGTTKVATVDSAWQTIPTAATKYNILDGWNTGGVKRLFTKESIDPGDWAVSNLIRTSGPVTTSVAKLNDNMTHTLRTYFGTGRNYYKIGQIVDDSTAVRGLYGVVDPCIKADGVDFDCTATVSEGSLGVADEHTNLDGSTDIFGNLNTGGSPDSNGWFIPLQAAFETNSAERAVTDPLATEIGVVFFTTSKPSTDACSFGGKSYIWAVRYDTGGTVLPGVLKGKAMIQLSTGAIKEVNLSSAFNAQGNRRTSEPMQGLPPLDQGLNLPVAPKPISKTLHMHKK